MRPSSAKAKGRILQQWVRDTLCTLFDLVPEEDIINRSSGANGEDLILSPAARKLLPISIECKNRKAFAIYKDYVQAMENAGKHNPVLIIKQNRSIPLAVVEAEYLFKLLKEKSYVN
jgi:hypothetical protein